MCELSFDVLARRRLGRRLTEMRESAEMSLLEAALAVNVTQPVVERLERGEFAATPPLARSLLRLYGQHDPIVASEILDLVGQAWQPGWWSDYRAQDEVYLGWEASACDTYEVATSRIPELLQTKAYAGTVWLGLTAHYANPHEVERTILANLDVLTMRQYRLVYQPTLRLHTVITEAALRAVVGGELVMVAQWLSLARLATWLPSVTLRVLPADADAQTSSGNGWQVLEFADGREPARLFRKTGTQQQYHAVSGHAAVQQAQERFDQLCGASLSPADSAAFLNELIDQTIAAHPVPARS